MFTATLQNSISATIIESGSGFNDIDRTKEAIKVSGGASGSPLIKLTEPVFYFKARRFLRWLEKTGERAQIK